MEIPELDRWIEGCFKEMDTEELVALDPSILNTLASPPNLCLAPAATPAPSPNPNVPVDCGSECLTQDAVRKQEVKCVIEGMVEGMVGSTLKEATHDALDILPYPAPKPASPPSPPPPPPPSVLTSQEINSKPHPEDERDKCMVLANTLRPPSGLAVPARIVVNTQPQPVLGRGNGGVLPQRAAAQLMIAPTTYSEPQRQHDIMYAASPCGLAAHNQGQDNDSTIMTFPNGMKQRLPCVGMLNGEKVFALPTSFHAFSAAPVPSTYNSKEATNEIKAKQNQPYIKKPPNAFMLFLKEQRPQPEFKGKSSGAVNVALALRWKSLTREEQAKYYSDAEKQKQLHNQQHPEWSNCENYGKKRQKEERKKNPKQNKASVPQDPPPAKRMCVMQTPQVQTSVMNARHPQTAYMKTPHLMYMIVPRPPGCTVSTLK